KEITVFAAASLTDVLQEIGKSFREKTGVGVRFSFASSSALAKQVETGAPADAFVSADGEWMDYLANHGSVDLKSRRNVAGNELVLIAPADSDVKLAIAKDFPLVAALGEGRPHVARSLGAGGAASRAGGERARGARSRQPRRGAARHRLPHGRARGAESKGGRRIPAGILSADRLSRGSAREWRRRSRRVCGIPRESGCAGHLRPVRLYGAAALGAGSGAS